MDLFNKRIIHRDLKPDNILLLNGVKIFFLKSLFIQVPKIADFGFVKKLDEVSKYNYNVGTPEYMCPQSLQNNQYSFKSDIWSLGCLFYEMLIGYPPWQANNEKELIFKIINQ